MAFPINPAPAPASLAERAAAVAEPVTGIVLAGGRSRRMGRDKAWVDLAGRPLIHWALDALREVTLRQVVVARDDPAQMERLAGLGVPLVVDRFESRGPLGGIHAGLGAISTDLAVVVACDMPLARPELLAFLAAAVGEWEAAVPYVGETAPPDPSSWATARQAGLQPLVAAYRRSCIEPLERLLDHGPLPTTVLISIVRTHVIYPDAWHAVDPDGRSFFNVNTPEDLVAAAQMLASPRT
jgi:molybdopterin-guanine dinucleotide biosynthesis protein A